MSMMREMPYLLTQHYVAIAMRDVTFPVSKAEIIEKIGDYAIRTAPNVFTPFREILNKIPAQSFSCAAEFYNALNAS